MASRNYVKFVDDIFGMVKTLYDEAKIKANQKN